MENSCSLIPIVAPLLAGFALAGFGLGAAYLLRARYDNQQIADERGAAGLLLIATIGSFVFALLALAIGAYTVLVCWFMPR